MSYPYLSPLRYPGGKRKLANFFKLLMLENGVIGSSYVEVFAGGASVGLALLLEEYASEIVINDLNASVHAFWRAVLEETNELCALIRGTPVTIEEWHRQRAIQSDPNASTLELGFSTFFMNRTNRSGIIAGGVIGGQSQQGKWKLDARYNVHDLVERVRRIGRARSRITLLREDGIKLTESWLPRLDPNVVVYIDPPYFVKGDDLYQNAYEAEDHARLASAVRNLDHDWVVSYDAAPEINEYYGWAKRLEYGIHYSAARRYSGDEIMFFSPNLTIPAVKTPVKIPDRAVRNRQRLLFSG